MSEADVMTVRANGNGGFDLVPCTEPEDRPRLVHEHDYAKLEDERDRLRDVLEKIADGQDGTGWRIHSTGYAENVQRMAREALCKEADQC